VPRPILALIHPRAIAANLARARAAAPASRVFAVVKANAYGHGIERVLDALRGADGLALLDLNEAERARAHGWRGPILLLEGAFEPRDLEVCSRLGLWHVVHCQAQIDWLAAHKTPTPHRVFLKLNSGMNRLGFRPELLRVAHARLAALAQVEDITLMTHFANADAPPARADAPHAQADAPSAQADALQAPLAIVARAFDGLGGSTSLANSAATLRAGHTHDPSSASPGPDAAGDWVRCGIVLYGSAPDHPQRTAAQWGLAPAMSLRTQLIAVQHVQAGESVGYGSTFTAPQAMRIGMAACGYADGYPRHAPTGTPVLVDGVRSTTVGRVSMDMLAVDLTATPQACEGSEVTLWGVSGVRTAGPIAPSLPIDEVAHAAGTIAYELMCALAARVPVALDDTA
jgi:alanine racemase